MMVYPVQLLRARSGPVSAPALVFGLAGFVLLVCLALFHPTLGEAGLRPDVVVDALLRPDGSLEHALVRHLRLPRTVAALMGGAALGVSGALFQAATRNPLASPGVLGVNAGAFLALTTAAAFGMSLPTVPVGFAGALAAAALTMTVAGGPNAGPVRLVLAGVAVALALGALANGIALLHEENVAGVFLWAAGSAVQTSWKGPSSALPFALVGLIGALALGRALDVLALGDEAARSRGQSVVAVRLGSCTLGALLAASAVAVVGPIGFVGLVAPNLVRLCGVRHSAGLLPLSAVWGAVFLLGADTVAQLARHGNSELPAGTLAALVGAPVFLIMIHRRLRIGGAREPGRHRGASRRLPVAGLAAALLPAMAAVIFAAMSLGELTLTPGELMGVLAGSGPELARTFVLELRLPRVLVAIAAGAMLALSGLLFQGLLRNPLASPELLGVSQAAGLAALLLTLVAPGVSVPGIQAAAFAGGFTVLALVLVLGRRERFSAHSLALRGLALAALCAAASHLLVVEAGLQGAVALTWLAGTTYARGWTEVTFLLPWAVVLVPLAVLCTRPLDVMALGEDLPRGLGLDLAWTRALVLGLAVALAATAVAAVGTVAFVGLVAPHAARLLVGTRHRALAIVTPLLGGLLMGMADVVGRLVLAPKEVPVGLITALLGAPYFLVLLRRARTA